MSWRVVGIVRNQTRRYYCLIYRPSLSRPTRPPYGHRARCSSKQHPPANGRGETVPPGLCAVGCKRRVIVARLDWREREANVSRALTRVHYYNIIETNFPVTGLYNTRVYVCGPRTVINPVCREGVSSTTRRRPIVCVYERVTSLPRNLRYSFGPLFALRSPVMVTKNPNGLLRHCCGVISNLKPIVFETRLWAIGMSTDYN